MSYKQLSLHERYLIDHLIMRGMGPREIGRKINRSASTISREIRRNHGPVRDIYWFVTADEFAIQRRRDAPRPKKSSNRALYSYIVEKLQVGWSPELIAGRLIKDCPDGPEMRVSHETIYRWVYDEAREGGTLYHCLVRCRKRRRKQRKRLSLRGQIPGRIGIEQRPEVVNERSRFGDWESDTMEGAKGRGGLATHVDRKSRYLIAAKLKDKRAKTYADKTLSAFRGIPKDKRQTMTVDNGKEFSYFKRIEKILDLSVYFADPYSPWQRGTNENTNGLLRRYFPKGTDFTGITNKTIANVVERLNNRPRKCLKYQTPHEIFFECPAVALEI